MSNTKVLDGPDSGTFNLNVFLFNLFGNNFLVYINMIIIEPEFFRCEQKDLKYV